MQSHFIKEYLLKAALEKAGIKSITAPYADARFLANKIAENLGEAGRVSDRTLVRCFEDKEKWTDTWGYLAAFVLEKGGAFQDLQPTDKSGRQFLIRTCLEEYKTSLETEIQETTKSIEELDPVEIESAPRRNFIKNGLYVGLGAIAGTGLLSSYQHFIKNAALPPLNMLIQSHPGNELFRGLISKWVDLLKTNSNGRIDIRPRSLNEEEKERKESLLQRLILGMDFNEESFDLYCSVNYHDEPDNSSLNFYGSVPFGMTSQEFNAWYLHEGKQLLYEYKDAYKTYLFGNSGEQMGGWFLKPIKELSDLDNMTVRMHGLGANVLQRSANRVKVFRTFLDAKGFVQKIKADNGIPSQYAIEYMNAHADQVLNYPNLLEVLAEEGFNHQQLYLYEKGWHERGSLWTIKMNRAIYELLKADKELLTIFNYTTQDMHYQITQAFENASRVAMSKWKQEPDSMPFEIKKFPRQIGERFLQETSQLLNEKYSGNKIYHSYAAFHKNWAGIDLKNGQFLKAYLWEELFESST